MGGVTHLIRGFEADVDRSDLLAVAIGDGHRRLAAWSLTIEMRFAGAGEEDAGDGLYQGDAWPVCASGRAASLGDAWVEELTDLDEADRASLAPILMPVYLAGRLRLTRAQVNAAALRIAAHRLAAPAVPAADLTAGLGATLPCPSRFYLASWTVSFRAVSRAQARAIGGLLAGTVVDHTGHPRGRVVELARCGRDGEPADADPDDQIEAIADHAANVVALRAPVLMAGALLLRAWHVEAREHEFAIDQRVRDLLGHPDRRIVSSEELHDAELRAHLLARNRSADQLYELARRTRHVGDQYSKFWAVDIDDLRRPALAYHEGDVLVDLARQLEAGAQREAPASG